MIKDVEDLVLKTIREQLGYTDSPNEVDLNTEIMDTLGADSLDMIEMLMAMEEYFEIEIEDDEAAKWKTPGDVVEFIKEATGGE